MVVLLLSACTSGKQVETIRINKMKSFSDADLDSTKQITDSDEIAVFKSAINKAIKRPGIVNVADPEFRIEVDEHSYYIWIQEEAGTIMNVEDTHTIYSLPKKNAKEVYEIIVRHYQLGE